MKTIEVAAAIIKDGSRVYAAQRGYGTFIHMWEFPGGKLEPGETPEEALGRELWEELEIKVVIDRYFLTVHYDYPDFHLILHCYLCTLGEGVPLLKEHCSAKWAGKDELSGLNWLPADQQIIDALQDIL
ncbi:(deoxy)nucleoside triphosphate pyrophosphohydrolase [Anaerolentibacter hominis]|uniref:(deoxy)nucleoside triphosphate pyrophosphohydrolase n=1 Tax=Anaerolentibacter hominis TaxID=3079009 RepID=UPI0031B869B3